MSKQHKNNRSGKAKTLPPAKSWFAGKTIVVLGLMIAAAFGIWRWKSRPSETSTAEPTPAETRTADPSSAAAATMPGLEKLKGRWVRPDGGYVVEIRSVDAGGRMDAAYFNPRPIHVARAEASRDGGAMKVFIELRDVNYPGSTYTLVYVPERDQLEGIYFQAALQQQYEVIFARVQ